MSDFLTRLAQRQLGQIASVEPRVPELYAPVTAAMPLPIVEALPTEASDSRRIGRAPMPAVEPSSAQSATAAVSNMRQGEPARAVNPAQRLVTQAGEGPGATPSTENLDAEVALLVEPKLAVASKVETSLPSQSKPAQPHSLRAKSEAPVSQVFLTRESQPQLMPTAAVAPVTAPPRFESKTPNRGEVTTLEREHTDSEPPVHVTIGRIEVTAVTAAPAPRRPATTRKPAMSLDDYLARRQRREP